MTRDELRDMSESRSLPIALQDFSRTYTPDGSIRALHFEIYFPPGAITLAPSEKKSAY